MHKHPGTFGIDEAEIGKRSRQMPTLELVVPIICARNSGLILADFHSSPELDFIIRNRAGSWGDRRYSVSRMVNPDHLESGVFRCQFNISHIVKRDVRNTW